MTSLVKKEAYSIPVGKDLTELMEFCTMMAKAPYYAKMGPYGVFAVVMTAKELGLPVMMSLNGGLYTFDGKVTMSAQMMNLMIVNAGHYIEVLHQGEDYCEIEFERSDRKGRNAKFVFRYTIQEAERAGYLKKDNWKYHRKAMLFARTISGGGRVWMPDVFMGVYAIGELPDDNRMLEAECEEVKPIDTVQQVKIVTQETHPLTPSKDIFLLDWAQDNGIKPGNAKYDYVQSAMEKCGWDFESILKWAKNNTEQFNQKYEAWRENQLIMLNEPPQEEI